MHAGVHAANQAASSAVPSRSTAPHLECQLLKVAVQRLAPGALQAVRVEAEQALHAVLVVTLGGILKGKPARGQGGWGVDER